MKEFIYSTIYSVYDDFSALILILDLPVVFTIDHSLLPEPWFDLVSWTAFSLGSSSNSLSVPLSIFCRFLLIFPKQILGAQSSLLLSVCTHSLGNPPSPTILNAIYILLASEVLSLAWVSPLDLIFSPTSFSTVPLLTHLLQPCWPFCSQLCRQCSHLSFLDLAWLRMLPLDVC